MQIQPTKTSILYLALGHPPAPMEDVIQGSAKLPEECTAPGPPSAQSLPRPKSSVNLRDLASAAEGLAPGRVHRSSQVVSTAELR